MRRVQKILSLLVLGVVLTLVTAPAFAQDMGMLLPSIEHDLSRQ